MRLTWSPRSVRDLDDLERFMAGDDQRAAEILRERLMARAETLCTSPFQGRPGQVRVTRDLPVAGTRYIILYRVLDDLVEVLAIVHTSRLWPTTF